MCRNIKTLHNFHPPATDEEIRASALQFVRKLSGFARPSKTNELAFSRAVDQVASAGRRVGDEGIQKLARRPAIAKWRLQRPESGQRHVLLDDFPERGVSTG